MLWLFSCPLVSNSLWPHGGSTPDLCPSPSSEVCPSSYPLYWWFHPAISSYDTLFFCPQSFPASGTFPGCQLFTSGDQNTGASASILPVNSQCWSPLGLAGLISLLSKGLSGVFFSTIVWKNPFFSTPPSLPSNSHNHTWPLGSHSLDCMDLVGRVISLLFNRDSTGFLPRSKHLLISWLQSPSAVILEPKKKKSVSTSTFPPLFAMK